MSLAIAWAEKRRAAGLVAATLAAPPAPAMALAPPPPSSPALAPVHERHEEPPASATRPRAHAPRLPSRARHVAAPPTIKPVTYKDISPEQERDLVRRCQSGDRRAGEILLRAHERLIYSTVRRYFGKGLDEEDVLQAGRLGFLDGILRSDLTRDVKLATYATWWAKAYAQRALAEEGSTIAVSRSVDSRIMQAKKRGIDVPQRLLAYRRLRTASSLDAPLGDDDDGATLGDMMAGAELDPEAQVADEDAQARRRALVEQAMSGLNPNEREVITRRMLGDDKETLEEAGQAMGLSRERIRQIEVKALAKMERALRRRAKPDDAVLWSGA